MFCFSSQWGIRGLSSPFGCTSNFLHWGDVRVYEKLPEKVYDEIADDTKEKLVETMIWINCD